MTERQNQYNIGLDKTPANYVPLSPLSFLARSAAVYPDHISTVYEGRSFTWRRNTQNDKADNEKNNQAHRHDLNHQHFDPLRPWRGFNIIGRG